MTLYSTSRSGKDAADHLAAGHTLDELEPVDEPDDRLDSWAPRNLALLGERPQIRPTLGGTGLVYPGKRHAFTGPQESAKTLAAYATILGVVRDGGGVVLIDLEMGKYDARDRLREMRATDDDLASILYIEPETPPSTETIQSLLELDPTLVVIDAAAGAFNLTELDDNKRADVEIFLAIWVRPFWRQGIATIVIDHVVKSAEGRGKYAIGSERKVGGIDVHLGFETLTELNRGGRGLYKIVTHKDRVGWLPRPKAAELEIVSDPDTHALSWAFRPSQPPDDTGDADGWRPTVLMERVSRYLETRSAPASQNDVERDVQGKGKWLRTAVECLVREGYVTESPGARGARLLTSIRAFREADRVPTASLHAGADRVPPRPPTASLETRATKPTPSTASHRVPTASHVPELTASPSRLSPTGEPDGRDAVQNHLNLADEPAT